MSKPFVVIVAGPNGSGKTTLTTLLRQRGLDFGEYVNPDDIAVGLKGSYDARVREAQAIADEMRDECIAEGRSFSFETVMSHHSKIDIMLKARDAGFEVTLFFVATESSSINVARVASRVELGGHEVADDKIKARYVRTIGLLPEAVRAAHRSYIFDNTKTNADGSSAIAAVMEIENGVGGLRVVNRLAKSPEWLRPALMTLGL